MKLRAQFASAKSVDPENYHKLNEMDLYWRGLERIGTESCAPAARAWLSQMNATFHANEVGQQFALARPTVRQGALLGTEMTDFVVVRRKMLKVSFTKSAKLTRWSKPCWNLDVCCLVHRLAAQGGSCWPSA